MSLDGRGSLGRRGEELAEAFLRTKGFKVLESNWRCRMGEIDLIVAKGEEIRFIEVKTRLTTTYGYPEEAVTKTKLRHLRNCVEIWLRNPRIHPKSYQVDVIAIQLLPGSKPQIDWIEAVL